MKKKNLKSMVLKKVTVSKLQLLKGKGNNHNHTNDTWTYNPYQCVASYDPKDCQDSVDPRQDDVDEGDS